MRNEEGTEIVEPISTGISQFELMASDLDTAYRSDETELRGLLAAKIWGTGAAGTAFIRALEANGGLDLWLHDTGALVQDINKMPAKLRKAVGNSLSTDAELAQRTARMLGPT
ncbi:hypothetical protein ABZW11_05090 [Nonomuraea sp. NPDC004580]|uniref:hypothetical protein n=1 Tax=Nonomuraea sp. NPDC004580 TaxID=3154552 RepID=UPI0033A9AEF5